MRTKHVAVTTFSHERGRKIFVCSEKKGPPKPKATTVCLQLKILAMTFYALCDKNVSAWYNYGIILVVYNRLFQ